jgi:tetratricopeptide (TPR) repeat protein
MKSLNFCLFLFWLLPTGIVAGQETDSLLNLLDKTTDSRKRVDLLIDLSKVYYYISYDSMTYFADKAYSEAVKADYDYGRIIALHHKCTYNLNSGDHKAALALAEQALKVAELSGKDLNLGIAYMILGEVYSKIFIYDRAFEYYTDAIAIFDRIDKDSELKYNCVNRMGILKGSLNQHAEALDLFMKALEGARKIGNQNMQLSVLNNVITATASLGRHKEAVEMGRKALALNNDNPSNRNYYFTAAVYSNMASSYLALKDTTVALKCMEDALRYAILAGNKHQEAGALLSKGQLFYKQRNYDAAADILNKVLTISENAGWSDYSMESALSLSDIYREKGDFRKSLDFHKQYVEYLKKVESEGNTRKLSELQIRYDFEKESLRLEAGNRRRIIMLVTALILAVMTSVIILLLYLQFRTRTAKAALEHKNLLLMNENLELDKRRLEAEQDVLSNKLEMRNKEIITNIMLLQKKNEILSALTNKLSVARSQFTKANREFIESCIAELSNVSDDADWKIFETQFNNVYESFYEKLDKINPDLTINNRRLCAYLKLKMTTKEIAALTNSSIRSIEIARYRLRQKLNIQDQDISLGVFLEHL